MKTLVNLTGVMAETDFDPGHHSSVVAHHAESGLILKVKIGSKALTVSAPEVKVAIPLDELFDLAAQHDSGFARVATPEGVSADQSKNDDHPVRLLARQFVEKAINKKSATAPAIPE